MKMLDYDPIDGYLTQLLKNWSHQAPLPLDGKERLYYQVGHYAPELPLYIQLLRVCLWLVHSLVIVPIDYLLTPSDFAIEDEIQLGLSRSKLDLSLAVRAIASNSISHGVEIFTYIT